MKWFDRSENVADLRPAAISANNKIEVLLNSMGEMKGSALVDGAQIAIPTNNALGNRVEQDLAQLCTINLRSSKYSTSADCNFGSLKRQHTFLCPYS